MDLNIYQILIKPVVTDKATTLLKKSQQIVFQVHPQANKSLIKQAIERLFDVKVEKVRVANRKGKVRRMKRFSSQGALTKRAFISLKEGYSIDKLGQFAAPAEFAAQGVN